MENDYTILTPNTHKREESVKTSAIICILVEFSIHTKTVAWKYDFD